MIKHITFLIVAFMASAVSFTALAEGDGSTFTISSNVALPVRVKPNGKSAFNIYQRSYTTSQRIADATITDAKGNHCMTTHSVSHSGGNVHHYWEITGVYSSSSSSSYDDGGSYSSNATTPSTTGQNLARSIGIGMSIPCEGHPFIALGTGLSMSCGEFVRAKFVTGGVAGLVLSGSVGKDWIFNKEYSDKLSWNAGLGIRFGDPNTDISINMLLGRTPWHPDLGLILNLELEHFFGRAKRFGVFGNIGVAATDLGGDGTKAKAHFDFMAGVAVKLWQK